MTDCKSFRIFSSPCIASTDYLYLILLLVLLRWPDASQAYSHVLTQAYVHVHHINYNDFPPLMSERDLNYRYPLRGPQRRRRKENFKTGRKGRQRETEG